MTKKMGALEAFLRGTNTRTSFLAKNFPIFNYQHISQFIELFHSKISCYRLADSRDTTRAPVADWIYYLPSNEDIQVLLFPTH